MAWTFDFGAPPGRPLIMSIARSLFTAALFVGAVTAATAPALIPPPTQCACGYQDSGSLQVYTDALIVYFNETSATEFDAFTNQEFANKKQQGWQSIYREGAQPANVEFVTANFSGKGRASVEPVLQLSLDPPDRYHLVNGGSLQSVRKDIQYGIFQASLQSAAPWSGGTALSFVLGFNSSDSLEMDFLNMNDPKQAVVSYLFNGEVPSAGTVTNYTTLQDADVDPWAFTEVQMDWNKTDLAFYIAGNNTRSVSKNGNTLPQAGKWLNLKTWSTGDQTYMAGPPSGNASTSHVLYVRTFFNSSVWTDAEHLEFDQRCQNVVYCSIDDMTLRGYTPYGQASTRPWQAPVVDKEIRKNAGIVAGVFSTFGIIALINVLLRRMPWRKLFTRSKGSSSAFASLRAFLRGSMYKRSTKSLQHKPAQATDEITQRSGRRFPFSSGASTSGIRTPLPAYGAMTPRSGNQTPAPGYQTPVPGYQSPASGYQTPVPGYQTPVAEYATSRNGSIDVPPVPRRVGTATTSSSDNSITHLASASTSSSASQESASEDENPALPPIDETGPMVYRQDKPALERSHPTGDIDVIAKTVQVNAAVLPALGISEKGKLGGVHISPLQVVGDPAATRPVPAKRIDYLAGLVAVACLAVTLHHFCQTFWPYVSDGYGPVAHYPGAEKWLSIFVGSYLLTQLWIGPFFLTATRFLSTNYLRNGNLEDIAKKELRRAPRLFVPIIIISLLEYFFLSLNLQADLQYLPSITWSTWPYVVPQPNFGVYLNNIVELAYAIPNVIPEIVSHYCIGVLWTVPVQLQFTYVVLTATVLIREIKTPWKRFGFYTLVILAGWYAKVSIRQNYSWTFARMLTRHRVGARVIGLVSCLATWKTRTNGRSTSGIISWCTGLS